MAGRAAQLSQVSIARLVFKRPDDFDPGLDPIVRIQAVRLRRSLERYYLLSGGHDPVRIELPRGGYIPVLRWATPAERPIRPPVARSGAGAGPGRLARRRGPGLRQPRTGGGGAGSLP